MIHENKTIIMLNGENHYFVILRINSFLTHEFYD
jgi:hypothetical protein